VTSAAQLAALDATHRLFAAAGIEHWLFGGWAVDFHVGRVTRAHGDVDLVVGTGDHAQAVTLLREAGWDERSYEHPEEGSRHERTGVRLELTVAAPAGDGTWRTPGRWIEHPWPGQPFGRTVRMLEGVACPVVELDALVALKESFFDVGDARPAERRDAHDLELLRALAR
jgi:hypothetical protein